MDKMKIISISTDNMKYIMIDSWERVKNDLFTRKEKRGKKSLFRDTTQRVMRVLFHRAF